MNFQPFTILKRMVPKEGDHHLDQQNTKKVPERIYTYLKIHFEKSFVSDIKRIRDKFGDIIYKVTICEDVALYRLKFNEDGVMVIWETEPLLELHEKEYEIIT